MYHPPQMNNTSRLLMLFLQHAALLLLLFQSVIYESYVSPVVNVKIFRLSDSPSKKDEESALTYFASVPAERDRYSINGHSKHSSISEIQKKKKVISSKDSLV